MLVTCNIMHLDEYLLQKPIPAHDEFHTQLKCTLHWPAIRGQVRSLGEVVTVHPHVRQYDPPKPLSCAQALIEYFSPKETKYIKISY